MEKDIKLTQKGFGSIETGIWNKGFITILAHPKKIFSKILHSWARSSLVSPRLRCRLHQIRGVRFLDPRTVFIGSNVLFDEIYPELIHIGRNVKITEGVKILAHFYDPSFADHSFYNGNVKIEDDVFIGVGTVIAAPVTIGKGAIVGANSVITRDVPGNAIFAGNPAEKIGERGTHHPTNLSAVHRS